MEEASRYDRAAEGIPADVLAVDDWSVEQLLAHVFGADPPEDVRIDFLGIPPGLGNRSKVQHELQTKEGRGDVVFQRAHTRLLEIFYENGRQASERVHGWRS